MKNKILFHILFLLSIIVLYTSWIVAQEVRMINFIKEEKALDEILKMVKASGKTGLLYFTSDGCVPCKMMQKDVFINDSIRTFVESNFIPFWFDNHNKKTSELSKLYNINAVPTMVFIKNKEEVIDRIVGYRPPNEFMKVLTKIARKEDTIESLKTAYELNPNDDDATWKYAAKLYDSRDYKNALPLYESFITRTFKDSSRETFKYLNLGICYEWTNNPEKAIDIYKKAVEKGLVKNINEKAQVFGKLSELSFMLGNCESAIKYSKMLPGNLKEIKILRVRGEAERGRMYVPFAYGRLGQKEMGKKVLEKLLSEAAADSNYLQMVIYLNFCMMYNLYEKEALPAAEKALELYNTFINTERLKSEKIVDNEERLKAQKRIELVETQRSTLLKIFGTLLGINGECKKAIEIWEKILDLPDSKYIPARSQNEKFEVAANIAALTVKSGKSDEGEQHFQQLLQEGKSDAKNLYTLSYTCYKYNVKLKDALNWAEQAVNLTKDVDPFKSGFLYIYAKILFQNGNVQKVLEMAEKAYELSPVLLFKEDIKRYKAALK